MSDTTDTSRASEVDPQAHNCELVEDQTSEWEDGAGATSASSDWRDTVTIPAKQFHDISKKASEWERCADYLERIRWSTHQTGLDVAALKETIYDELNEQWREERSWYPRITIKNALMSLLAATGVIGLSCQLYDVKNTIKSLEHVSCSQGGQTELWLTDMSDPTKGWTAGVECDSEGKCTFSLPELLKRGAIRISSPTDAGQIKAASSMTSTQEEVEVESDARARPVSEQEAYGRAQEILGNATGVALF